MILPWPRASMPLASGWASTKQLVRLTEMTWLQASSGNSVSGARNWMPALLTSTSIPPSSASSRPACSVIAAWSVISNAQTWKSALGTSARSVDRASCTRSRSRPCSTTVAPARASPVAMAQPIPRVEPVTSARWPVRSNGESGTVLLDHVYWVSPRFEGTGGGQHHGQVGQPVIHADQWPAAGTDGQRPVLDDRPVAVVVILRRRDGAAASGPLVPQGGAALVGVVVNPDLDPAPRTEHGPFGLGGQRERGPRIERLGHQPGREPRGEQQRVGPARAGHGRDLADRAAQITEQAGVVGALVQQQAPGRAATPAPPVAQPYPVQGKRPG